MGTHDLDTVKGPFTYEALPPEEIVFAPLNQEKVMNGKELMEFYKVRSRRLFPNARITSDYIRMINTSDDTFILLGIPPCIR